MKRGARHLVLLIAWLSAAAAWPATLQREADPLVLSGSQVPTLIGLAPGDVVAYRFASGWHQVPIQVDERDLRDLGTVYAEPPVGFATLVFTDAGTHTGPDQDPTLDANDEIVVMCRDSGNLPASYALPPGAVPGTGVEITIQDPVDGGVGRVYLFRQDGSLDPSAGQARVLYDFNLLSGDYLTTYGLLAGPNPEDTTLTTAAYNHHFSDRWIDDGMRVFAGGATGVDLLDRHKSQFAPGNCSRTENTFSNGEGAFVVNRVGPLRALRSYLGANSGPLTQREHLFYEARHDILTFLRVHAISGVVDHFDYTPAATGTFYFNDLNTTGVRIDGSSETPVAGPLAWEMVTGAQGTVVHSHRLDTDIAGVLPTSYYLDSLTPPVTQCTGDAFAFGDSGPWFNMAIPCTDPVLCPASVKRFVHQRTLYYAAPGVTVAQANLLAQRAATPLIVSTASWPPPTPGAIPADPSQGAPLRVSRGAGPGDVVLTWGASCAASATAHGVYEGVMGSFASHAPRDCAVSGLSTSLTSSIGSRYFLVVPQSAVAEGSYGTDSAGSERPPSGTPCRPQIVGACP